MKEYVNLAMKPILSLDDNCGEIGANNWKSDANDTAIASEDTIPIEMTQCDEISVNDDNQAIGQANEEEIISEGNAEIF